MVSILVRGLDESVKWQSAEQTERHGHFMEAEVRDILTKGVVRPNIDLALIQVVQEVGGADDPSAPERDGVVRAGQALT